MGKVSQGCLFLENCKFAWRGFMQGSSLPGVELVWCLLCFQGMKWETEPLQVTALSPPIVPSKEGLKESPGLCRSRMSINEDQKILLFSVFLSLNQDFPERTQTCFEYCRLWVRLCKSVVFWICKTPFHNSCRGMTLQGKQKYLRSPQTVCTKQSLSAGGLRFTRIVVLHHG